MAESGWLAWAAQSSSLGAATAAPLAGAAVVTALTDRFQWLPLTSVAVGYLIVAAVLINRSWATSRVPSSGHIPPSNLPPPPTHLLGRESQVERLREHLADRRHARLVVISGVAGIGKTAFALHIAHRVAREFTGGELFARFDPDGDPQQAANAIRSRFIAALSGHGYQLPSRLSTQKARYRRLIRTLHAGRRLLIVFDDVARIQQVKPLLPHSRWCTVIITSRTELPGLPATYSLRLDALERPAAKRMLGAIIGRGRIDDEKETAEKIVDAAARHPLAIQLVGMALANRPNLRLSVALDRMVPVDHTAGSFENALDLSYAMLTSGEQRALLALGLMAEERRGRRFAPWELGLLLGREEHDAWQFCDRLTDAGLLERHSTDAVGVQYFRPLERVEQYARLRAGELTAGERDEMLAQLDAGRHRRRQRPVTGDVFEALLRQYELGALSRAFKDARDTIALARDNGDGAAVAEATVMLAELHAELGGMEDVQDLLRDILPSLVRSKPISTHPVAQARALRVQAKLCRRLRQVENARAALREAHRIGTTISDRAEDIRWLRESAIVESLGDAQQRGLGLIEDAWELSIDQPRQHAGLSYAHSRVLVSLRHTEDSHGVLDDGARVAAELGQTLWQAWILYQHGVTADEAGDHDDVVRYARQALELFGSMRHRYGRAHCRLLMGHAALARRELKRAGLFYEEALETFHNCGDPWMEAEAAELLAQVRVDDDLSAAIELLREAEQLFDSIHAHDQTVAVRNQLRVLDRSPGWGEEGRVT